MPEKLVRSRPPRHRFKGSQTAGMVFPALGPLVPLAGAWTAQVSVPGVIQGLWHQEEMSRLGGRQERRLCFRKSLFFPLVSPVHPLGPQMHQTGHEREKCSQNIPGAQLSWSAARDTWLLMKDGWKKPFSPILLRQQKFCRYRNSLAWVTGCHLASLAAQKGLGVGTRWFICGGPGRVCVLRSLDTARTGAAASATTLGPTPTLPRNLSTLGALTGCTQGQPASKYLDRG